jgi:uncharacterized protein YcbK (DUF882 family)
VPFGIARSALSSSSRRARIGYRCSLAALIVFFGCESLQTATADGDTRTIAFFNTHTKESLKITYKVNGRYDEDALQKINMVARDWREGKPTKMDPHLIDLLWAVHRELGAKEPISIVCGFRSPGTNAMLRSRSRGVAKFSQHMLGKAMDFFIPGVPLEKLREAGLRAQRGGVGYYPSSNFVHLDTGGVRHWPRMPEAQLAAVLAKGPLSTSVNGPATRTASAASFTSSLTKMLGIGSDDDDGEDSETTAATTAAPSRSASPARAEPARTKTAEAIPMPPVRPAAPSATAPSFGLASTTSRIVQLKPAAPAQGTTLASRDTGISGDMFSERGIWQGMPESDSMQASAALKSAAVTSQARRSGGTVVASAGPVATASLATTSLAPWPMPSREPVEATMSYAPVATPSVQTRPTGIGPAPRPAARPDTTVAMKRTATKPAALPTGGAQDSATNPGVATRLGPRLNDPWIRAMIVSPSAGTFMSTSLMGTPDYRVLGPYLQKPASSVMMTFSDDPHFGMSTDKFSGSAIVFVATVTFAQRTALLQPPPK